MLQSILSDKHNFKWLIFHAFLGFVCTITYFALIFWFYIVLITTINRAIVNLRRGQPDLYFCLFSYLTSFEMLGRMAKAYPLIPIELSKYLLILFALLGIIVTNRFNLKFFAITIIISISLFFDYSHERVFSDIINNYFGVLALGLTTSLILGLDKRVLSAIKINVILKLVLFTLVSALFYTFIKTPNFEDIEFKLNANFETSGGAATNQVSTVFGLAVLICFYFWYKRIELSGYRIIDLFLAILFFAQGLLTLSRGGIIVAILAILVFFILDSENLKVKNLYFVIISSLLLLITFNFIDGITGGKLFLRYQGETEGTYNYGAEKNLMKITSGRSMIFEEDLKLWYSNPLFGAGVGSSKYLRAGSYGKVSSHIEMSRLLAEHGILGLIYFIVFLSIGAELWIIARMNPLKSIYFILFLVGFLTTFHAAMRTFVTPLLISLSAIGIHSNSKRNETSIHRSN